jgi:GDP-4-dehydro-6-deoxy-D-mannose reductase
MGVLVTGGTGSIGIHLLNLLGEEAGELVSASLRPPKDWQKLQHVKYVELDLLDANGITTLVRDLKPTAIYHLASQSNVGISLKRPAETLGLNIIGTQNLLDAARKAAPQAKVLLLSSSDVYGRGDGQLDVMRRESDPLQPLTPFAVSKAGMEMLAYQYRHTWGTHVCTVRPFNYAGPFQAENFVLPSIAAQLARIVDAGAEPVVYAGNLDVSRDFLDVRDLARALVLALNKGAPGSLYNVCSGRIRTVRELVEMMIETCGVDVDIRRDPVRERGNEQPLLMGSVDKLMQETGWKPLIDMEDCCRDLLGEMRRRMRGTRSY